MYATVYAGWLIPEKYVPLFQLLMDAGINGVIEGFENSRVNFNIWGEADFVLPEAIRITNDEVEFVGWFLDREAEVKVTNYTELRIKVGDATMTTLYAGWRFR